ncbi:hypothetical protein CEE69_01220 [Rhodopirellula bahusiensis]|uniref:Sulfatase N-terminal domain-containing protein n=2 Tax=Rhodopirellula bahusiensis TaxID=2014065 RepID=A0A2G1WE55_9BACT|nr:hypothetical protein CEE69_01220 [Rhodopirellula bahusiensis]
MPDKRSKDAPLFQRAFIFEAAFTDETKVSLYIDDRFKNEEAAEAEARRYVGPLGKLPASLRQGVARLVVHEGGKDTTAFSDAGLIVVYSANATQRISKHDLEETIFLEAVHAAWDAKHARSEGWQRAQLIDGDFAVLHAKRRPPREDLAESALFAYTIQRHPERIPDADRTKLGNIIQHRIAYVSELLEPIGHDDVESTVQKPQSSAKSTVAKPPNVILILADDLATGDLGGGDSHPTRTPNLDRLANESVRFSQAYSGSCVCAPARAALLTGRYPHRTGVVTLNMNKYPKLTRIRRDETTIADVLKDAGYATGLIGKWHTGRGDGFHPMDRGFDEFQGFDGSDDVGYFQYSFSEQREVSRVKDKYLTDDLTHRAIGFVRSHQDHPFFLHLAHYAPHRPLEAPAEIISSYRNQGFGESVATIYAMIEVMDRGIGELLSELEKLQLADNTIVIFASDNGPDPVTGERFNNELRGTKYQVNEGGIRVPLFVRWPHRFTPGQRDHVVSFVDLLPTILDLCNVKLPTNNRLDGQSFTPVLSDSSARFSLTRFWQWNRAWPNYTHNAAIRKGQFKLVRPYVTRSTKPKDSTRPTILYDLKNDPTESHDVTDKHPSVARQMSRELEQWCESIEQDRIRPETMPTHTH